MSRALIQAALAVLFLVCRAPASPGAGDLFNAAAPENAARVQTVVRLEAGRYTVRDGRLHDSRAADPAKPFLTNSQVLSLLVTARMPPIAAPTISLPAPAIVMPDPLSSVIPRRDPAVNFDGGAARLDALTDIPLSEPRGGPLADPGVLQARFLSVLRFRGPPAERAALAEAAENVLKTRTGRELARQFILEGAAAEVGMAAVEGSTTVDRGGTRVVSGTRGFATVTGTPPGVTISRAYLDADPEWRRVNMAGTFGHELFGHVFEHQRAMKAGIPSSAYYHYQGDEIGSRLIAWSIKTELGGASADPELDEYLADPHDYIEDLLTADEYYAMTLDTAEMRNPADTLRSRRPEMEAAVEARRALLADLRSWLPIIAHFKTVHGVEPERLRDAEGEAQAQIEAASARLRELESIVETIDRRLAHWRTAAGAKEKAEIVRAAGSDYFRRFEERLEGRARALAALRAASDAPEGSGTLVMPGMVIRARRDGTPAPEPISLGELGIMYREDLTTNPKHWETMK